MVIEEPIFYDDLKCDLTEDSTHMIQFPRIGCFLDMLAIFVTLKQSIPKTTRRPRQQASLLGSLPRLLATTTSCTRLRSYIQSGIHTLHITAIAHIVLGACCTHDALVFSLRITGTCIYTTICIIQ